MRGVHKLLENSLVASLRFVIRPSNDVLRIDWHKIEF